jgi:hypothetical protein
MNLLASCVVPLSADVTVEDGGVSQLNGYPIIKDAKPSMPGPQTIDPNHPQTFTLTLSDADRGDTLYVRVFRDYDKGNTGRLIEKIVTNQPDGPEDRAPLDLSTGGWCGLVTDTNTHQFDVVVADRPWDDDVASATPGKTPVAPGKTSTRTWLAQCKTTP